MGMQLGHLLVLLCVAADALTVLGSAVAESPWRLPQKPSAVDPIGPNQQPSIPSDRVFSPKQAPASSGRKIYGHIGGAHRKKASHVSSFAEQSPAEAPQPHKGIGSSSIAVAPSAASFGTPAKKWFLGRAHSPTVSNGKIPHGQGRSHVGIPEPSYPIPPPTYSHGGPSGSYTPALSPTNHFNMFIHPPAVSPLHSSFKKFKAPPPSLVLSLPPPPPNSDCTSVTCTEPLTYSPPGLPCGCVWPIQVELRFSVPIYTFFTLVTELAKEIAASVSLNSSQVRIMGANAATQQLEKSIVLINLIPRGVKFNDTAAFSIYSKFWGRQVLIKASLFGDYEVVYVRYPGLPPSPPSSLSIPSILDRPYAGSDSNGRMNKPLGVDVPRRKRDGLGRGMIVVIALSSFTALVVCVGIIWLFLLKFGIHANNKPEQVQHDALSSRAKPTGNAETTMLGNMAGSSSMYFTSDALTYSGSTKTFSLTDMEEATNNFDASRILGEGGFGLVYSGILDDGKKVAVKVLKRYDQHGSREFLAEIEMLGRLHHRNLVQLIGICSEGHVRCLVYELIPNGSVESHLHGVHKETDPLDWDARMKIALGSARGLAYLHEDSNPRVIHRDFKSSNILLEHDFTPKVSDFGLARAAIDEGNKHISTHVMGTFGYLAPEYAMTGHLLVKSDVYSYGVVLLELLTGRKPVDLSQPPGQENLVAYVRPLLTSKESLETVVDPEIKSTVSFDTLAKVAAIASMCVQPEVSHRPFMGEVVQALKLVCNEFDDAKVPDPTSCSLDNLLIAEDGKKRTASDETTKILQSDFPEPLATSDLLSTPTGLEDQEFGSVRRHSSSGPLRTGRRKQFWQRLRSLSSGSVSDHGLSLKLWPGTS